MFASRLHPTIPMGGVTKQLPCKAVFHRGLRRNPCLMLCAARFAGSESLGRSLLVPALDRMLLLTRLRMHRLMRLWRLQALQAMFLRPGRPSLLWGFLPVKQPRWARRWTCCCT